MRQEALENIVGKEETAGQQHFLHFPQCFLRTCPYTDFNFLVPFIFLSANAFNMDQSKI